MSAKNRIKELAHKGGLEELSHGEALELLGLIGDLRRGEPGKKAWAEIKGVEKMVRSHGPFFLRAFQNHLKMINLEEKGKLLLKHPARENLKKEWLALRHQAELAYWVLREYWEEIAPQDGEELGDLREVLDRADEAIFFDLSAVKALWKEGEKQNRNLDRDFFWWVPPERPCPIPPHRRSLYLTGYLEERWEGKMALSMESHLQECPLCRKEAKGVQEILLEELWSVFEPSAFAAAQGEDFPLLTSLLWRDKKGEWEGRIYLSESTADPQVCFSLKIPETFLEREFSIKVGDLVLAIRDGVSAPMARKRLQRALKESNGDISVLVLGTNSIRIPLFYRGER